jgi:tetratricopeptide (TPR) repeat protein
VLIAPNGPMRPELALRLPNRVDTWNGEALGLRTGNQVLLEPRVALTELARLLRPTMRTAQGRALADALTLHLAGELTETEARAALTELQLQWLPAPGEDASGTARLAHRCALLLQPELSRVLSASQSGDVAEALKLYRLAEAAGDTENACRAILLLGSRAGPGELLDGQPLTLVVGRLLEQQGDATKAQAWYHRAHDEHPDDPRAALRLAALTQGSERFALLREAYARGERTGAFMRQLARAAATAGESLLALNVLDQLISTDSFDAIDLENAALQCLALERTDWALLRLRSHPEIVAREPRLQRLELICELSAHGMTARAQDLAAAWRARGEQDGLVESLLRRYGE